FSKVKDYPKVVKAAIKEMHRQVGDLILDERGIAKRGLIVRHLVLPDGLAGTRDVLRFLAKEVSPHTYVNIMGHYRPCGEAQKYPPLNRRIKKVEYEEAIRIAREEGISRIDQTHTHLYPMIFGE
ncbi:MAG: radical SAM protein, partial [Deltaproteobacteria bacterium]|nr:radical SAM protein [Deltaproteobacteria bacterium]